MRIRSNLRHSVILCLCGAFLILSVAAQTVPAPKDTLGFTPGDDRKLASWASIVDHFQKLDAASDRVMFQEIGKTTMGAPFVFATISSPENLKNLEKYKQINAKLADPRTFKSNDAAAKRLIAEGKTIVLITCGIHSNEVGSTLSSMLIAYRLASDNSAEIKKILDNTIIILVPSLNPDGVDIIKNWYDKTLGTKFEGTDPPELYHKYVGHDDNRDWYAFTQIETQLTVDKIHNVWHPQIVNDIHQQGSNGARLFLPPYMEPVEPNVPKQIVEGYTELGNYVAADLRKQGFEGITTNSTYDAWTPSRAYSHYHGGVRILSETASCKLATPITVTYDQLRNGEGYDVRKESDIFGPVWKGGEWHLRDITNYMISAAFSILHNAADNREKWLTNFYAIGKDAVRPRREGEVFAYLMDASLSGNFRNRYTFKEILERAGVKFDISNRITRAGKTSSNYEFVIDMSQPYASFAKALIDPQKYPDRLDDKGNPIPPYDVTAHAVPLLMNVHLDVIKQPYRSEFVRQNGDDGGGLGSCGPKLPVLIYRSYVPSMDEGWSRWLFDKSARQPFGASCREISTNSMINSNILSKDLLFDTTENPPVANKPKSFEYSLKSEIIIFPDQSPNQILNGYPKGSMPDEYTGGIGKEGVENLKKFVEAGGTLVFLNRSSDFAIEQFNLPIKDVTKGLNRKDFFIPGSILRTELDLTSPIAKGMPAQSIAWFENGPVFEVIAERVRIIARYPTDPKQILLSGWALGAEKIAGKAALVEVTMGKGKIILFGFRPQYRGQSLATFPLLFNAISR